MLSTITMRKSLVPNGGAIEGEESTRFQGDPTAAGPELPTALNSSVNVGKSADGKDVSEKLAAVSLAAMVSPTVKTK